jgi:hypothetical protein
VRLDAIIQAAVCQKAGASAALPLSHLQDPCRVCSGAQKLKAEGNDSFKLKNFPDAIRKYTGTLDILDQLDGASISCPNSVRGRPPSQYYCLTPKGVQRNVVASRITRTRL